MLIPHTKGHDGAALLGAWTLRLSRQAVAGELGELRASIEVGSGLVAAVLEEIRVAEQYLAAPSGDTRQQFHTAGDEALQYEKRLEALGLTGEDRITVNKLEQLHASIQAGYSIAHALADLGREREAMAQSAAVRPQAAEVTRLVRDLSSRQAAKAVQAGARVAEASRDRRAALLDLLGGIALVGFFLARWALLSVQGPLSRLVTAAGPVGSRGLPPLP